ncbi:MAG: type II toxin-antitoxin system VapC family toxin [Beutenbergiaceae bacterium]
MILVDTSIWIDHLHASELNLVELLNRDDAGVHVAVIEELAVGSIANRTTMLGLLSALHQFPVLTHREMLTLVDSRKWWGRGLSVADVHLLGAVLLTPGAKLWTRDRRLREVCIGEAIAAFLE